MKAEPMPVHADLHIHTRHSACATIRPADVGILARKRCLDVVAITDHNTLRGIEEVRAACGSELYVIAGEEIKTNRGEIIGYFLSEEIPAGLSPAATVAAIRRQSGLVSIPHPFDRLRSSRLDAAALAGILPHVDMIETFNARDLLTTDTVPVLQAARTAGVIPIACSDAHTPIEVGRCRMILEPFSGPQEFLDVLRRGRMITRRSPFWVHLITKVVRQWRKKGGAGFKAGTAG